MAEREREIKRPVTRVALKAAAEAGYHYEVHTSIQFADPPLTLAEGVGLVTTAMRVEALKLEKEADVLQDLAGFSDDPRWQEKFGPKSNELRSRASANREEADKRAGAAQEFQSR